MRVQIEDIKRVIIARWNISLDELNSGARPRRIARPRQVAMYLSRKMTSRSLPDIGRRFGGRDHTTVLHACRRIEALMAERPQYAIVIAEIERQIEVFAVTAKRPLHVGAMPLVWLNSESPPCGGADPHQSEKGESRLGW
jgi:hypothetical protein